MLHFRLYVLLLASWQHLYVTEALSIQPRSLACKPHRYRRVFDTSDAATFNRRLRWCPHATEGTIGADEASWTCSGTSNNIKDDFSWMGDANLFRLATSIETEIASVREAALGIQVWRAALSEGRVPDLDEGKPWPEEPLRSAYVKVVSELGLSRFTATHPTLANSAIEALVRMVRVFKLKQRQRNQNSESSSDISEESYTDLSPAEDDAIALTSKLSSKLELPLRAISLLDGLVDNSQSAQVDFNDLLADLFVEGDTDAEKDGKRSIGVYGTEDGMWAHTGWSVMENVQAKLKDMPELRDLFNSLGRRPNLNGDKRWLPRTKVARDVPLIGVRKSGVPGDIDGLCMAGSLARMLPSEALLLKAKLRSASGVSAEPSSTSSSSSSLLSQPGRAYFMSKLAEERLLSVQWGDWWAEQAVPELIDVRRPRRLERRPSGRGGPIVICLDTSWSMAGPREDLAKAVVLEAARTAHAQSRRCYVAAFSGATDLRECEVSLELTNSNEGLSNLLDFLGSSFRGGTDVCRPMRWAMSHIAADYENTLNGGAIGEDAQESGRFTRNRKGAGAASRSDWSDADILLVTDGELRMPPIDPTALASLTTLREERGVEVHGLLVGKPSSPPLDLLCSPDCVHTFLSQHDPLTVMVRLSQEQRARDEKANSGFSLDSLSNKDDGIVPPSEAAARRAVGGTGYSGWSRSTAGSGVRGRSIMAAAPSLRSAQTIMSAKRNKWLEENEEYDTDEAWSYTTSMPIGSREDSSVSEDATAEAARIWDRVDTAFIERPKFLSSEQPSSPNHPEEVEAWVQALGAGLVERDVEVRLLVLAALSGQHLLLLGPPGTAKSELARRLSAVVDKSSSESGGVYFERTLTRFSTPDELFGPLSLKALEDDRYERRTNGFLPSARVAFLDEIFKASSAILNTLLGVLNERTFDQGPLKVQVPLLCCVAASNELPDSEDTEALYDRFLIRRLVSPVSDGRLSDLLLSQRRNQKERSAMSTDAPTEEAGASTTRGDTTPAAAAAISASAESSSLETLASKVAMDSDRVEVPTWVVGLLGDLRRYLRDDASPPTLLSDRRLCQAVDLLRVAAAANGRATVSASDVFVLQHVLWAHPDDAPVLRKWLLQALEGPSDTGARVEAADLNDAGSDDLLPMDALGGGGDSSKGTGGTSAGIAQAAFLVEGLWAQARDLAAELEEDGGASDSGSLVESGSTVSDSSNIEWHDRATVLINEATALEELLLSENDAALAAVQDLQSDSNSGSGSLVHGNVFLPPADTRLLRQRCVFTFHARASAARSTANQAAALRSALSTVLTTQSSPTTSTSDVGNVESSSSSSSALSNSTFPLSSLLAALRVRSPSKDMSAGGFSNPGAPATLRSANQAIGLSAATRGKTESNSIAFTPEELALSRKAAKASMKPETFRAWRAAKKQGGEED